MSSKRRVYEVARELGMDNKAFLAVLDNVGVPDVKNHMSVLTSDDEARVKRHLGKEGGDSSSSAAQADRPRVVKRRAVVRRRKAPDGASEESAADDRGASASTDNDSLVAATDREDVRVSDTASEQSALTQSTTHSQTSVSGSSDSPSTSEESSAGRRHANSDTDSQQNRAVAEVEAPKEVAASRQVAASQQVAASSEASVTGGTAASSGTAASNGIAASGEASASRQAAGENSGVASESSARVGADAGAQVKTEASVQAEAGAAGSLTVHGTAAPQVAKSEQSAEQSRSQSVAEKNDPPMSVGDASDASKSSQQQSVSASSVQPERPALERPMLERPAVEKPKDSVSNPRAAGTTADERVSRRSSPGPGATGPGSGTARPAPSSPPSAGAAAAGAPGAARPSSPPKRGIDVWEGRPGVPMHNHRPGPRRVQYDAKAPVAGGAAPGGGGRRGPGGRMMRGGPRQRGIGSFSKGRGGAPVTKERNAHKKVVRIEETVNLQTLAGQMGVKTGDMLRKLFQLGMQGININSTLDADTAKIIGEEFGWDVEDVAVSEEEQLQKAQGTDISEDNPEDMHPRPPVVTVMGHVDHGKTSLLDAMRESNVAAGESGGITQHIGAYSVGTKHGNVTFLDTPGHAAFTQMRARGAKATDIVVLVVAADDGVMPQTKEAIQHAKSAGVAIVVAINKCDKPEAQPERVRRELSENGLVPEEWGGDTLFCEVSAHTKVGIPELLEKLALQAEVMDLRANPDKPASGIVIESQLDRGRGPVATVLVTEGTLHPGDVVLAGGSFGKVRAMHDWAGKTLKSVGPSDPVAIVGLNDVPRAGDHVYVVKDLKTAQGIADTRKTKERRSLAPSVGNKPRTLEEIAMLMSEAEQLELKVIVKADVGGSAEAVSESLVQLSTEKVRVIVVLQAAGAITENDVNLAVAAGAIIVGFNVKAAGKADMVAQREGIEIRQYSIIYNVLDDVRLAMEGMLAPKMVERELGKAEVRQTFRISKTGTIAGCMVSSGVLKRGAMARLIRGGTKIWEGKVSGLKRFKEDVKEVKEGFECGISLDNMNTIHVDDIIEVYDMEAVKQSL